MHGSKQACMHGSKQGTVRCLVSDDRLSFHRELNTTPHLVQRQHALQLQLERVHVELN